MFWQSIPPSDELLTAILDQSRVKSYEAKEILLHAGEIHTKIVLVQEGKAVSLEKVLSYTIKDYHSLKKNIC
ncbi:cyclic nucleotide-binding domain-containing protein [Sphingobacterium yanglingense]|uniref:hypothetical protein n=1 Tax=Sphingobacterium yanglingense TaxID=1437280 RepID=UPI00105F0388|nr:hypothetical protein [Sphingobacterium yanglingense]